MEENDVKIVGVKIMVEIESSVTEEQFNVFFEDVVEWAAERCTKTPGLELDMVVSREEPEPE